MTAPAPLDDDRLRQTLGPRTVVLDQTTSTNAELMQARGRRRGDIVLARAQTAGRGRSGRDWASPKDASLYLSLYWSFPGRNDTSGVSLVAGVAVQSALVTIGVADVRLKWPNDLWVGARKLGGILVEGVRDRRLIHVVIGVGINGRLPAAVADGIGQPVTDLEACAQRPWSLTSAATAVGSSLRVAMSRYERDGLAPFVADWRQADALTGAAIRVVSGSDVTLGRHLGIDEAGALLVDVDGRVVRFVAGEVSVRPA